MVLRHVLISLSLSVFLLHAQERIGDVQVRVTFSNGNSCHQQLRLDLTGSARQSTAYTNNECMASFTNMEAGNYHIVVSGEGIETTDSGIFEVDGRKAGQHQFISVKRTNEAASLPASAASTNAMVSAAQLAIPRDAQKEFDKANGLIAKENWSKAQEKLTKALEIYPQYVEAYNNVGVVVGRMGDTSAEKENLEKAVTINPRFAPAYVNLGKLSIKLRDFVTAEAYFVKAVASGAADSLTLTLLANVQLLNKHFEQAVSTCLNLHNGPPVPHTFCHYISAHAMENENRIADARQELKLFLTEESLGPRADQVRKELAALQAH